jgi:hypothetical protein
MDLRRLATSLYVAGIGLHLATATALAATGNSAKTPKRGEITGRLYLSGGPPKVGMLGPLPARRYKIAVSRTTASIQASNVVARTVTAADGSFRLSLRPGTYQIAGQLISGQFCGIQTVTVHTFARTHVKLICQIK